MKKESFKHLIPGKQHTTARAFLDYDGKEYQPGKMNKYHGNDFLPYDDGLTLYFLQNGEDLTIRLQWREEEQETIIDNLEDYFVEKERA